MIKKLSFIALALLFAVPAAFSGVLSDDEGELAVNGAYFLPGDGDFDLFERGLGVEVSYREWFAFPWGVGLSLGYANWAVDDHANAYKFAASDYDGHVSTFPIGADFYFNVIDWDNWDVILSTGLRYAIVDSSVSFAYDGKRFDVDMDNALLWNIALEYDHTLTEDVFLTLSAGFQTDIMKADSTYDDQDGKEHDLRDTSFEAFFGRVGVKFLL